MRRKPKAIEPGDWHDTWEYQWTIPLGLAWIRVERKEDNGTPDTITLLAEALRVALQCPDLVREHLEHTDKLQKDIAAMNKVRTRRIPQ